MKKTIKIMAVILAILLVVLAILLIKEFSQPEQLVVEEEADIEIDVESGDFSDFADEEEAEPEKNDDKQTFVDKPEGDKSVNDKKKDESFFGNMFGGSDKDDESDTKEESKNDNQSTSGDTEDDNRQEQTVTGGVNIKDSVDSGDDEFGEWW